MKSNLRIGEAYVLSKIYRSLLAVTTIMCLYAVKQVSAQEAEPAATAVANAKPLQIGDTIAEYLWHLPLQLVNHPPDGGKDTITLNDYRDKLIILDFWATWCKPCISSLYKLDTLQKQFADELVVIPTTYEAKEKAGAFIANKGWSLPSAVGDTILKKYFPYQSIPHQVWMKDGKVQAIVGPEYANSKNIAETLAGNKVKMKMKTEVEFDNSLPLLLNENGGDAGDILFYSVIAKRLNADIGGISRNKGPNKLMVVNSTLANLLEEAYWHDLPRAERSKRVFWAVSDSLRNALTGESMHEVGDYAKDSLFNEWLEDNVYCYNLILSEPLPDKKVRQIMQSALRDYFNVSKGLDFKVTKRRVKCLAISRVNPNVKLETKGGTPEFNQYPDYRVIRNKPFSLLVAAISNAYASSPCPVVDFTNINGNLDMTLSIKSLRDIKKLNAALLAYGIAFSPEEREIEMLEVTDEYKLK